MTSYHYKVGQYVYEQINNIYTTKNRMYFEQPTASLVCDTTLDAYSVQWAQRPA